MAGLISYQNNPNPSLSRTKVQILKTDIKTKKCIVQSENNYEYYVDLSTTKGGVSIFPAVGEIWYIEKNPVTNEWELAGKDVGGYGTYAEKVAPGDWVFENREGRIFLVGTDIVIGGLNLDKTNNQLDTIRDDNTWLTISNYISALSTVDSVLDSKISLWVQEEPPWGVQYSDQGDIWADSNNEYSLLLWDGNYWIPTSNEGASDAFSVIQDVPKRITQFYQRTAPSDVMSQYDLWVDLSQSNQPVYQWTGEVWRLLKSGTLSDVIDSLKSAADEARTSASGKNKVFYSAEFPSLLSAPDLAVGDLLFKEDEDNRPYKWNGSGWDAFGFGNLAVGNFDAAVITSGKFTGERIELGAIESQNLANNVLTHNLIRDPGFEEDYALPSSVSPLPTQWSIANISSGVSAKKELRNVRRSGTRSLTVSSTSSSETTCTVQSALFDVTPGSTYVISGWVRGSSARAPGSPKITLGALSSDGVLNIVQPDPDSNGISSYDSLGGPTDTDNIFNQLISNFVIPDGCTKACLIIESTLTPKGFLAYDDFSCGRLGDTVTEITSAGLRILDDSGNELIALMANRPNYFSISYMGEIMASIDNLGAASFSQLNVDGYDSDGDGVNDSGFTIYGTEFTEWLNSTGGLKASAEYYSASSDTTLIDNVEIGLGEVQFVQRGTRNFEVNWNGLMAYTTDSTSTLVVRVRWTSDGSQPTTTNSLIADTTATELNIQNQIVSTPPMAPYGVWGSDGDTIRILLTVQRLYGTGTIRISNRIQTNTPKMWRLRVMDIGEDTPDTWTSNSGILGNTSAPPSSSPALKYTTTWKATSSKTFSGGQPNSFYKNKMSQGYWPSGGQRVGAAAFNGANSTGSEKNKTVSQALSGATIQRVRVFLYANHWYYPSGGTARIGLSSHSSMPSTLSSTSPTVTVGGWSANSGKWVTIPTSEFSKLKNGGRVVTVGPGSNNSYTYYGVFNGYNESSPPLLEITYTK